MKILQILQISSVLLIIIFKMKESWLQIRKTYLLLVLTLGTFLYIYFYIDTDTIKNMNSRPIGNILLKLLFYTEPPFC